MSESGLTPEPPNDIGSYTPIPVASAEEVGVNFVKQIVVIVAWDEVCGRIHTTTWGERARHKEWAADLGVILARAAGGIPELAKQYEDFRAPSAAAESAALVTAARRAVSIEAVETFIKSLPWSAAADDDQKGLVAGNIRNFASHLREILNAS